MIGSRGRAFQARVACIQVHFRGNPRRHRNYLIAMNKEGDWLAKSVSDVLGDDDLDLRRPADVKALEAEIGKADLSETLGRFDTEVAYR